MHYSSLLHNLKGAPVTYKLREYHIGGDPIYNSVSLLLACVFIVYL